MAIWYVDYEGGNNGNNGTSFAQRWQTIQNATSGNGVAAGDTVRVMGSPAPTSLGVNATWTAASRTVTLASAVTQTITDCQSNWTASANVTCSTNSSDYKENTASQQIAVADAFTTGLAAYFATGALDLSGYKQVSFWIKQTAGTVGAASSISLALCSDAVGAVVVDTVNIPSLAVVNQWVPVTVNLGAALGAAIASIAFYVNTDNGAQTFLLDDVIACKDATAADSLSLTSLLGQPDSTGAGGLDTETWYGIQSINGTTVKIDNVVNTLGNTGRGWYDRMVPIVSSTDTSPIVITATNHGLVTGDVIQVRGHYIGTGTTKSNANGASKTVTVTDANTFSIDGSTGNGAGGATGGFWRTTAVRAAWKRETVRVGPIAASGTIAQSVAISGASAGSLITVSGGWNRTDMTTQTLETWFDCANGFGTNLSVAGRSFVAVEKIGGVRSTIGLAMDSTTLDSTFGGPGWNNCTTGISFHGSRNVTTVTSLSNGTNGTAVNASAHGHTVTVSLANSHTSNGYVPPNYSTHTIGTTANNSANAFLASISTATNQITIGGAMANSTCGPVLPTGMQDIALITLSANNGNGGIGTYPGSKCIVNTDNNTTSVSLVGANAWDPTYFYDSRFGEATLSADTNLRDAIYSFHDQDQTDAFLITMLSGTARWDQSVYYTTAPSWKLSPTSTTNRTAYNPLPVDIATFTCVANRAYTVTCWVRRTNTALTATLLCRGRQLAGIPSDVSASMTAAADTWEQLSISFTPTEAGPVTITGQAYGGTTHSAYFSDLAVNGAPVPPGPPPAPGAILPGRLSASGTAAGRVILGNI